MAMPFMDNVAYGGKKPLDSRTVYDTVANMVAATKVYDGIVAYVTATKKYYNYDSTNETDPTLGKWREFSTGGGGGASALADLTDVMLDDQTLAEGQHLEMGNSGRWINAVPLLSKMDDVNITNPANKDTLVYNSTTQKWENKDTSGEKAVINGYAYTAPLNTVQDFITECNKLSGKTITVQNNVFNGKSVKALVLVYAPTTYYIIGSASPFTLKVYNLKRSGSYWFESSRLATNGVDISGYNVTPKEYANAITAVNNITIKGTSEVDVSYPAMPDDIGLSKIYYTGTATIEEGYYSNRFKIEPTLRFYTSSAHTTEITPETGKIYVDIPTGDMYEWTGTAYQKVGGSSSGYDPSDAAFTDLADGDYVPMYDTSASATKKSLWSNIKSVLKTYFDTLYQGATDKMTSADMDDVVTPLPSVRSGYQKYSTEEQIVGEWIDGKTIYQKTIIDTMPVVTTGGTAVNKSISLDFSVDKFVNLSSFVFRNGFCVPLPYNNHTDDKWYHAGITSMHGAASTTPNQISLKSSQHAYNNEPVYITIQYTKTT